jgi:hypothetical protein
MEYAIPGAKHQYFNSKSDIVDNQPTESGNKPDCIDITLTFVQFIN